MERFAEIGFPLPKDEEWRFTPIGPIAETDFSLPASGKPAVEANPAPWLDGVSDNRITLVNGQALPDHAALDALPVGVVVCSLREALDREGDHVEALLGRLAKDGTSISSLNTAFMEDVLYIRVPAGLDVSMPVVLEHVADGSGEEPTMACPRVLVDLGARASLTLVEAYTGSAGMWWMNGVTEIAVGPSASLEHYRLQAEPLSAYHTGRTAVRVATDGRYTSHVVHTGGSIARHDLGVTLAEEGGACSLSGLYICHGRQLVDNHTVIDHAAPRCESRELYKGVLDGQSHAVYSGKVYVRPGAQQTDSKQTNKTLLLSDGAHVDTKPQLEIFADDVRCTHGATVGQLDAESLFYLRSRGLSMSDARSILIHAFASEVVDRMSLPSVRSHIAGVLLERLPQPSLQAEGEA